MKKILLFTLIVISVLLSACKEDSANYKKGMEEINAGNYYAAIDVFTVVVGNKDESKENKANALLYMAEANLMLDQVEEAVSCYKKALEYDSKNTKLLITLGNVLQNQGKSEDAVTYFEKAVSIGDEDALPYVASAYMGMNRYDEAMDLLIRYSKDHPLDVKTNYYLSKCSYESGNYEAALAYAENALLLNNEEYENLLLYQAAVLYEMDGQWDKAYEYMGKYIENCPDDDKALAEYSFISTRVGTE